MRTYLLLAMLAVAIRAGAHGVPILITTEADRLALLTQPEAGVLLDDGFEIVTEDPSFGVNFAATGPPAGTELGLETLGGLLYWDGVGLAPTDSTLLIESPEFDSQANPNESPVIDYSVTGDSGPQDGLRWARYTGADFWDAHGFYTLSGAAGADPAEGLYGVAARLIDETGGLAPSDPFILPLLYGPAVELDQGLAAFNETIGIVAGHPAGDYDRDSFVDRADFFLWRDAFGQSVIPGAGADGNADGFVDAADYTFWRDAFAEANASSSGGLFFPNGVAIPEPAASALALFALFPLLASRN